MGWVLLFIDRKGSIVRLRLYLLLMFFCSSVTYSASDDRASARRVEHRQQFLNLEKQLLSLSSSQLQSIQKDIEKLGNYPLVPYLKLLLAERTLASLDEDTVQQFLAMYAGTPIANRLRKSWLSLLADRRDSSAYIKAYQPALGVKYTCTYLLFQVQSNHFPDYWFEQVSDIWLSGKSRPKTCDPVFKLWQQAGWMTPEKLLMRVEKVIREGDQELLGYLQRKLPKNFRYLVPLWRKTKSNASYVLRFNQFPSRYVNWEKQILYYGIVRLAWQAPVKAIRALEYWQSRMPFSQAQERQIYRAIAISLVMEGEQNADTWLAKANVPEAASDVRHWHLAYMLREKEWQNALEVIQLAPVEQQQEEAFRYWKARGFGELHAENVQQTLLEELAQERHFYGFLASARLNKQPTLGHQAIQVSNYSLATLSTVPAVQRSYEWFKLGRFIEARREWYYLNQRLSQPEKQAAAMLASEWGWHDQAIRGFAQIGYYDDINRRFPLAFAKEFQHLGQASSVDPALAMAVARRESAFMVDAVSPVGARGLMQLMPGTVNYLTNTRVGYSTLIQPEENLKYGMQYLRYLGEKLNHNPVLVSASYNAGWQRVIDWLPQHSAQPLDVWIENIPYRETRHYVKAVMTYRHIYAVQLGQESHLFDTLSRMTLSASDLKPSQ